MSEEGELVWTGGVEHQFLHQARDDRMFALMDRLGVKPAQPDVRGTRYAVPDGNGDFVLYLVTDIADAFLDIADRILASSQPKETGDE